MLKKRLLKMTDSNYREWKKIKKSSWNVLPKESEWKWDPLEATTDVNITNNSLDVLFHPVSSQGTGAIRGDMPFTHGQIYYWEIEVIGSVTATDILVGVGTKDFDLKSSQDDYCSLIGSDDKSWGYSYMGVKHHNGKKSAYGLKYFKSKTIIGVRLDMWRGTLEFFHDRKPLGVAFKKVNKEELYPMVCSTSCQSQFKVMYSRSSPVNLQLLCLEVLDSCNDTLIPPGLLKIVKDSWWIPKKLSSNQLS